MSHSNKQIVLQALGQMRGDDRIDRARAAFKNCTQAQMNEQYGKSGRTRMQILSEYEAHDAKIQSAINWINSL